MSRNGRRVYVPFFSKEERLDFANEVCLSVKFLPRSENVWSLALGPGMCINKGCLSLGRYASLCTWSLDMNTW